MPTELRTVFGALCVLAYSIAVPHAGASEPEQNMPLAIRTVAKAGSAAERSSGHKPLQIGVYDPHEQYGLSDGPSIEHVFIYWQSVDAPMLAAKMRLAAERGRTLLVTVEPYTKAENWRDGGNRLFKDILGGKFDDQIRTVCNTISTFPGKYWIRWGHEMEDPSSRYPWARGDPDGYIKAYRYFADACKELAPRARLVWSPKGNAGLGEYFPGSHYVDIIGVALWGLEKWDIDTYGKRRSFIESFAEKYRRVEKFRKPVIIAELGISGSASYRERWMTQISRLSGGATSFPLLAGVVYFNDKEPYHWPDGYGSPDWSKTILEFGSRDVDAHAPALLEQEWTADRNLPPPVGHKPLFAAR